MFKRTLPILVWMFFFLRFYADAYTGASHLVKWLNWVGAGATSKGDQEEIAGSNPGCVLFRNEDSDAVFSPNFPRGHEVSGVGFSYCTMGPTISLQCKSSKQMEVGEEIRAHKSCRPQGLAN